MMGDFGSIGDQEMAGLPEEERLGWALLKPADAIEAELQALGAHRATLDHAALAADRLAAPELALFEADRPAELARRYEQATARKLSRTLVAFHRAEARAAPIEDDPGSAAATARPAPTETKPNLNSSNEIGPMASFGETLPDPADTPAGRRGGRPADHRTAEISSSAPPVG